MCPLSLECLYLSVINFVTLIVSDSACHFLVCTTGALQDSAGHQEQGREELSRTLQLEEVVPESAGEWQALANVF